MIPSYCWEQLVTSEKIKKLLELGIIPTVKSICPISACVDFSLDDTSDTVLRMFGDLGCINRRLRLVYSRI